MHLPCALAPPHRQRLLLQPRVQPKLAELPPPFPLKRFHPVQPLRLLLLQTLLLLSLCLFLPYPLHPPQLLQLLLLQTLLLLPLSYLILMCQTLQLRPT